MAAAYTKSPDKTKVSAARKQFFSGLFDMSWRLASAFLIPVFIGVWLDSGSEPKTFTIIGLVIGVVGSVLVIKKVVSEYSRQGGNE
jgi:F0F1-type ATP synthase assembly protein I